MPEETRTRKTDRRTIYTRNIVKDALLELLAEKPFDKITVASVCKQAEITRATFYLHFDNLSSVLDDVLDDALTITQRDSNNPLGDMRALLDLIVNEGNASHLHEHNNLFPTCQRVADDPKYKVVFQDESLSGYIIKKIYTAEKDAMLPVLMDKGNLSRKEADKIFMLILYGVFAVNKSMKWEKNNEWYQLQGTLLKFIVSGLDGLTR